MAFKMRWAATTALSPAVRAPILFGGEAVIARHALRVCSGGLCTPTCALVLRCGIVQLNVTYKRLILLAVPSGVVLKVLFPQTVAKRRAKGQYLAVNFPNGIAPAQAYRNLTIHEVLKATGAGTINR